VRFPQPVLGPSERLTVPGRSEAVLPKNYGWLLTPVKRQSRAGRDGVQRSTGGLIPAAAYFSAPRCRTARCSASSSEPRSTRIMTARVASPRGGKGAWGSTGWQVSSGLLQTLPVTGRHHRFDARTLTQRWEKRREGRPGPAPRGPFPPAAPREEQRAAPVVRRTSTGAPAPSSMRRSRSLQSS
jgi:hypothetical protein